MSLHAELLVRVLTDGAIHFVRPDLEGEGQCGRRAGLDELRLPLDALPFDLESVWDAPRVGDGERDGACRDRGLRQLQDRKSTRLNSSHLVISYAVFCLKKKKKNVQHATEAIAR